MKQIAKRVYNNNVVLSENASGEEIILVGKGLAFGLNKGDLINTDKIEKKFELKKEVNHKFQELIQDVSMEEILICDDVINYIKKTSNKEIDDSIYVTLTDHIINMIDRLRQGIDFDSAALLNIKSLYKDEYNFAAIIPVSVEKNYNLETILDEIESNLKEGPAYYNTEEYTDQTLRQLTEETIREKALRLLKDEVPHGIFIEVDKMKLRKTIDKEPIYDIEATIYCIRESHKGIIIGKSGAMLKKIGTYARQDLEKMFDCKINLKIWVKVKQDWINNENFVKKFKSGN